MYIDQTKKPYSFCPGCSHHVVLDSIGRALEKLAVDPKKVVLVSDIGCVGLSDKYFNVHTFHGLHGRSFTYACGIKLANPELMVFVLVGDGGCGIGGAHLINAARRNIGIKVICFNNHNFGMTGGQHSVTTPFGAKTATTPAGSIERPFDLSGLAMVAGAPFVARVKAFDTDLDGVIEQSFKHEGFSFTEIWEICTAYFMPSNSYKKTEMDELLSRYGFKTGVLKEETFPEYSKALNKDRPTDISEITKPRGIKAKFQATLEKDEIGIVVAGSAGMKIISAAHNFGEAAISSGLWVSQKDDYPVTVQAGHSLSEIKISKRCIDYLNIESPDAVIVVSKDGLKEIAELLPTLREDTIVIADHELEIPPTKAKIHKIELKGSVDKTVFATTCLTKLLTLKNIIPQEAFKTVLENITKEKIRQVNLAAFEYGLDCRSSSAGL